MSSEQSKNAGCLGISSTAWGGIIIIATLLTLADQLGCNILNTTEFIDDLYISGNKAQRAYEITDFKTGYNFMKIGEDIWANRGYLKDKGIKELEIIFLVECVDKFGNESIKEAGRYKLDADHLDYLFKCKTELAYIHFSQLETYMKLAFRENCNGPIYKAPN